MNCQYFEFIPAYYVSRYMDHGTWTMLAYSMALLTESDLSLSSIAVPLAEQLLYLAHGEQALGDLEDATPPPKDMDIPQGLWETLQRIPLSLDYYNLVVASLETHPQFWGAIADSSEGLAVRDFSDFPWRAERGSEVIVGLDDHVLLKCLSEEAWLAKLSNLIEPLTKSVSVPLLSKVLRESPTEPVLLYYEESCPRSQALLYVLEQEVTDTFKVRNS